MKPRLIVQTGKGLVVLGKGKIRELKKLYSEELIKRMKEAGK